MYHTMDDLAHLHDYAPYSRIHKCIINASFLNFVFSSTAVSTPSQSGSAKPGRGQLVYHMNNHLKYN